jgi:Spy/CpxP family protein refolding chaperone
MKHDFLRKLLAFILALALVFAFTALAFAQGSTTASQGTAASDGQQSESSDSGQDSSQDQQAVSQKTELYTIMGLIAMGAMYVGIREKNRRR